MSDTSDAVYQTRTYGARQIGYGEKPGIAVVDFQNAFTDPQYELGGAPLIQPTLLRSGSSLVESRDCFARKSSKK